MAHNKNPHYDDLYFSENDGMEESFYVFIQGNHLPERLQEKKDICVGETGFGTGLNLLTLLNHIKNTHKESIKLRYICLEKYPLPFERIEELLSPFSERLSSLMPLYEAYWREFYQNLVPGWNKTLWSFPKGEVQFELYHGDAKDWAEEEGKPEVEAWFLDGHSPDKNPEIWALEIMQGMYRRTVPGGTLATFTAAGIVKRALREAGFTIQRKKGFGKKRHMVIGEVEAK
jgi:tRNA U34 5-methylaminomethyl-2-thiouridine-forming methyltransferase MnmC